METWVAILQVVWSILFILGIIPNLIVIYFVLFRTLKEFRTYSVILFDFALTETISVAGNWFIMERVIPSPSGLAFASYGICQVFGARTCFVGHTIMLHTYINIIVTLPLSFAYRYYVLFHSAPKPRIMTLIALLAYVPSFVIPIFLNQIYAGPEIMRPTLAGLKYVDIYNSTHPVYGLSDIHSWQNIYILLLLASSVPSYAIVLILRKLVLRRIESFTDSMSDKTKKLHRTLVRALSLQACVPSIMILAVLIFALGQTGIVNNPMLETSTLVIPCFIPILNGSITIFGVPYYRKIAESWLPGHKSTPIAFTTTNNHSRGHSHSVNAI